MYRAFECVHLVAHGNFWSHDKHGAWSQHSIGHSRKLHAARKFHSSVLYRTGVIDDQSFTSREYGFSTFVAPVTLTLTR